MPSLGFFIVKDDAKTFFISGTFDSVGSTELQNAGKAGLVTVQGKISAVLGTVLVCKSSTKHSIALHFVLVVSVVDLCSTVCYIGLVILRGRCISLYNLLPRPGREVVRTGSHKLSSTLPLCSKHRTIHSILKLHCRAKSSFE